MLPQKNSLPQCLRWTQNLGPYKYLYFLGIFYHHVRYSSRFFFLIFLIVINLNDGLSSISMVLITRSY